MVGRSNDCNAESCSRRPGNNRAMFGPTRLEADPENRLLWHMPRRRMEFEPLRDRLLVAAGRLDDKIGGRSVMIHKDATSPWPVRVH